MLIPNSGGVHLVRAAQAVFSLLSDATEEGFISRNDWPLVLAKAAIRKRRGK